METILNASLCEFGTCLGCTVDVLEDDGSCEWCSCASTRVDVRYDELEIPGGQLPTDRILARALQDGNRHFTSAANWNGQTTYRLYDLNTLNENDYLDGNRSETLLGEQRWKFRVFHMVHGDVDGCDMNWKTPDARLTEGFGSSPNYDSYLTIGRRNTVPLSTPPLMGRRERHIAILWPGGRNQCGQRFTGSTIGVTHWFRHGLALVERSGI